MSAADWVWVGLVVTMGLASLASMWWFQHRQMCRCGHHRSSHVPAFDSERLACGGIMGRRRLGDGTLVYDTCRCEDYRPSRDRSR